MNQVTIPVLRLVEIRILVAVSKLKVQVRHHPSHHLVPAVPVTLVPIIALIMSLESVYLCQYFYLKKTLVLIGHGESLKFQALVLAATVFMMKMVISVLVRMIFNGKRVTVQILSFFLYLF